MKILVSACLLGENCKYNGGNNYCLEVAAFVRDREIIPVCPEVLAGLGIPRTPIEIQDGLVVDRNGNCVDGCVRDAVRHIMEQLDPDEIQCAVLKARSPTCGVHKIYDGTFSGTLVPGSGVFAQALREAGCTVLDEEDLISR